MKSDYLFKIVLGQTQFVGSEFELFGGFGWVRSSVSVGELGFGRVRSSDQGFGKPYNLIIFLLIKKVQ